LQPFLEIKKNIISYKFPKLIVYQKIFLIKRKVAREVIKTFNFRITLGRAKNLIAKIN